MKIAEKIGANLKQARKDVGLTQQQVAQKFNMTQQQYSRFENGIFELNYTQILELCDLYNITPNDLFSID
ncbi:MAG: helix-turn-helix transcriptional regulator [Clostridia bacterium]|nr:helix-turn-helix transcriptional regulator [Clostridia bacterium]